MKNKIILMISLCIVIGLCASDLKAINNAKQDMEVCESEKDYHVSEVDTDVEISEKLCIGASDAVNNAICEAEKNKNEVDTVKQSITPAEEKAIEEPKMPYTLDEQYLLAKIAMAEAEGLNIQAKQNVISVVINRMNYEHEFPNTIHDVIFEPKQFTPISNGRWDRVEPNEDCWLALTTVVYEGLSTDALYFETCENENNWHSRNLEYVTESDGMRFYK